MNQQNTPQDQRGQEEKASWEDPRLSYVKPALNKQGNFNELTAEGFFGTFTPPQDPV